MRRIFRPHRALAGLIALTTAFASAAACADDEADAKPACLAIGKLIMADDHDGLLAFFSKIAENRLSPQAIDQITLLSDHLVAGGPRLEGPIFLAERNYGDVLHRAWYMLVRDGQPVYLRCNSVLSEGHWTLANFNIDDDREKIPLP